MSHEIESGQEGAGLWAVRELGSSEGGRGRRGKGEGGKGEGGKVSLFILLLCLEGRGVMLA